MTMIRFTAIKVFVTALLLGHAAQADVLLDDGSGNFTSAIPAGDIFSIVINPDTGDVFIETGGQYFFEVTGSGGGDPQTPQAPSVTLRVNGGASASVDLNDPARLSWVVSGADSCSTSNGNAAWASTTISLSGGSSNTFRDITIDYTGSRSFALTCSNSGGNTSRSVTITGVNPVPLPDTGGSCGNNVRVVDWDNLNFSNDNSHDFPEPYGIAAYVTQSPNETLAIRFDTITAPGGSTGRIELINLSQGYQASLSSSCGTTESIPCMVEGIGTTSVLSWQIDNAGGRRSQCNLDRGSSGKTYYLNISYPSGCRGASQCTVKLSSMK